MSRHYSKNGRPRHPPTATPRLLKTKDFANDNYQEPTSRRNRKQSKHASLVQQAKQRRKAATPSSSESSDDFDADDASDEQSEDDDDEGDDDDLPAALAPSLHVTIGEAGHVFGEIQRAGSVESMFGENGLDVGQQELPTLEDMRRFEENLFATVSDDDAYAAVEDISDSDDEAVDQREEQRLIAELSDDNELEELDLLNQIDGMSAYGFGDDSEATAPYPPSSQGSDSADDVGPTRHVHFNVDPARAFNPSLSESPTFSRALLPSALPDSASLGAATRSGAREESDSNKDYDCMSRNIDVLKSLTHIQLMLLMTVYPRRQSSRMMMKRKANHSKMFRSLELQLRRTLNAKDLLEAFLSTKAPRRPVCSTRRARSC